ncbi:uncharacterized protein METZ01_LOCUS440470, partial [marine metagenome]
ARGRVSPMMGGWRWQPLASSRSAGLKRPRPNTLSPTALKTGS